MTGIYEKHVLPYVIDLACGVKAISKQREKVVPQANGKILEVGVGTGRNAMHYAPDKVTELWGLDPGLHSLARKRLNKAGLGMELVDLSAEKIPMEDASFDTVLVTYTLCTIPDVHAALLEMKRVLKPDGKILFCEHGLAPDENVRRWQARINPIWKPCAGGCHLDRDIPALLADAGFRIDELNASYIPGPRPFCYNYWGRARAA